jgi:hypothetical protein
MMTAEHTMYMTQSLSQVRSSNQQAYRDNDYTTSFLYLHFPFPFSESLREGGRPTLDLTTRNDNGSLFFLFGVGIKHHTRSLASLKTTSCILLFGGMDMCVYRYVWAMDEVTCRWLERNKSRNPTIWGMISDGISGSRWEDMMAIMFVFHVWGRTMWAVGHNVG